MAKKAKAARKSAKKSATKSAAKSNGRAKPMDAIQLLKSDHRTVEGLFEEFESTNGPKSKQRIANQICMELIVHAQIEEEIFYPAIKQKVEEEIYTEAHVEHDGAKMLIAEILDGDPEDEFYDANVKVLSEMIKHHVKEEEQRDGMFAQAKQGEVDLVALGEQLAARKMDLTNLYKRTGLPRPMTRTMKRMPKVELGQPIA
ncbi:hemerythrin domain-containing protein [Terricaulis sp.]|uniref:hemerythrin domain-containing protein n=1 Tax=Terricaulis sp. TaxID=2768686 RepID=UPI002AC663FA|nr:hemerythrin domain-containing protein [Terricaulis sp.]MDZ4690939.1 hemerythrin domain-containing protein [Terricaulis sp.]